MFVEYLSQRINIILQVEFEYKYIGYLD